MTKLLFLSLRSVAVLMLLAAGASAEFLTPAKAAALRARFEARQKESRTWSAAFAQKLAMKGLREPVVSEGVISYRAPGDLRINFSQPADEYVLVLGDRLFVQKPGKRIAEKSLNDNAGKPFQSLLGLLQGRPSETEAMYDPQVSADTDSYTIELTRKADAGARLPQRITTILAEGSLEIREVTVELPNGGSLSYSFRNAARNKALEAGIFTVPVAK